MTKKALKLKIFRAFPQNYQCWAIIGTPVKRHLNGVLLAGRWWPANSGILILPPIIKLNKKKTFLKDLPYSDKTFWIRSCCGLTRVNFNIHFRTFQAHEATVFGCCFTPDNQYLVSASSDGDLNVWDAQYGHGKALFCVPECHDLGVTCCDFSQTYGSGSKYCIINSHGEKNKNFYHMTLRLSVK